ncbi:MAG: hypothetical protein LAT64_08655 [Phycisphaerales bacterium]|nr:hypothetical protein [Planctomycetota bacterium]MCH8508821.1 hypothetical protein [Phycisphaerales bacterium]
MNNQFIILFQSFPNLLISAGFAWSYFRGLPRMLRREEYLVLSQESHGVQAEQITLTSRWRFDWIHLTFGGLFVFSVAFAFYFSFAMPTSYIITLWLGVPPLLFAMAILCWLGWAPWRLGPVLLDPEKLVVPGLRSDRIFSLTGSRVWSRRLSRGLWACLVDNGVSHVLLMIDDESAVALRRWACANRLDS